MGLPKPNPTLDKLCRFLNSVRYNFFLYHTPLFEQGVFRRINELFQEGTDKVFMTIQYSTKIINWHLRKGDPKSPLAQRLANLAGPVSDFRILLRYYGLIPLLQWIIYSEANPAQNAKLQWLTRAQNVVNVIYYPLEHAYWLGLHEVIPMDPKTRDKIGMWSCRFWAAYVILYFYQLMEEHRLLTIREKDVYIKRLKDPNAKVSTQLATEELAIQEEKKSLFYSTIINAAYFPLTLHWSMETSSLSDVGVGVFGTVAAIAQLITAWKSA